jgi:uncharacterized protein YndB with AHSA1/START domain
MTYNFEVSDQIPASPEEIYDAWMSSAGHSAMTGGVAHIDPAIGAQYDACDGYIHGTTVTLARPTRLVQTWRSAGFTEANEDSQIEVLLEANGAGTLVRVLHSNVPDDHRGYEDGGWQKSYFDPMKAYFESR